MTEDPTPEGPVETTPLTLSEGVKAFMGTPAEEEPAEGQPPEDDAPEGPEADDDAPLEDQGSEDEGEPEDDGQPETYEEEPSPESDGGRFVAKDGKVKLPDGTVATVDDLIKGNLRDKDYRQKTMEAAAARKAAEAQSSAIKQREQQLHQQLEYAEGLVKSILPEDPDPSMFDVDPHGYLKQKATYDAWQKHLAYIDQTRKQSAQAAKAKADADHKVKMNAEWEALSSQRPDLKDENRFKAFGKKIGEAGEDLGFSKAELQRAATDRRMLLALEGYADWKRLQASKAKVEKKIENRPPVQKGGSRTDPARARTRAADAAMERLNKSGSLRDGVAAYLAMTKSKG